MVPKICSFEGCPKPIRAKGYCVGHYCQLNRGQPLREIRRHLPRTERFESFIDKSGSCWQWTGALSDGGYARFGSAEYGHRVSWELANGQAIPLGMQIDHTCHNRGCVKPGHLRLATGKQNAEHHSGPNKNSKSGVRGVYLHKRSGKWYAQVRHSGIRYSLPPYDDLAEAESAVIAKRNELHAFNDRDRRKAQ